MQEWRFGHARSFSVTISQKIGKAQSDRLQENDIKSLWHKRKNFSR